MLPEIGAKVALEWIIDKLRKGLLDPALVGEWESKVAQLEKEIAEHERNKAAIENVFKALGTDERGLWGSSPPVVPYPDYNDRIMRTPPQNQPRRRPTIITTVNYKGGVGKTTTTANLAAYFDLKRNQRVLLIDLDYQGSMTTTVGSLSGITSPGGDRAGAILGNELSEVVLSRAVFPVGPRLPKTSFVPSFYGLARIEERLMVEWLLQRATIDVRYRLAKTLLDDHVTGRYDVVLIDAPPRLSTATINALTASSFVLTPAMMNPLSVEPVANFVFETQQIMNLLNPRLAFVGVVETMAPGGNESQDTRKAAISRLDETLSGRTPGVRRLDAVIKRKPALTQGSVAYLTDPDVRDMFDALGDEIVGRIGL
jgi:chromosome partitioning protein